MDEILAFLQQDINNKFQTEINGRKLSLSYEWEDLGRRNRVQYIEVYADGVDPFTGEMIPRDRFLTRFHLGLETDTWVMTYGDYLLHFDAVLRTGERLADYVPPEKIHIEGVMPFVSFETAPAAGGWTQLVIETNCSKRISGKLWIRYDGRHQLLPPLPRETKHVFYLPFSEKDGKLITVVSDASIDKSIPVPARKSGK